MTKETGSKERLLERDTTMNQPFPPNRQSQGQQGPMPAHPQQAAYQPGAGRPNGWQAPYGNPYAQNQYAGGHTNPHQQHGAAVNDGNGLSIASMVLGIVSIPFFIFLIPSVLAIVFGFMGKSRAVKATGKSSGFAIAGIVTGFVSLGFLIVYALFIAIFISAVAKDMPQENHFQHRGKSSMPVMQVTESSHGGLAASVDGR